MDGKFQHAHTLLDWGCTFLNSLANSPPFCNLSSGTVHTLGQENFRLITSILNYFLQISSQLHPPSGIPQGACFQTSFRLAFPR